jgi:hypothetical protein
VKARLLKSGSNLEGPVPVGTVFSGPLTYQLCEIGMAEPADEECYTLVKARGKCRRLPDIKDLVFVADEPPVEESPVEEPMQVKDEVQDNASREAETFGDDSETGANSDRVG